MISMILKRNPSTEKSTTGVLFLDGDFFCFTLEDVVRQVKIKGETAIPFGTYNVIISHSVRFKRLLPLLCNVPGFDGIRIHPGNTDADTEGCILVGTTLMKDFVGNSRAAFDRLFTKLYAAYRNGEAISITIKGVE